MALNAVLIFLQMLVILPLMVFQCVACVARCVAHDCCQASVGSNALLRTQARVRVALSSTANILSALALLLIKETVFLLSGYRQASERQELAHDSTCPFVICPKPEVAALDFEFPFLCDLGAGVLVALLR